MQIYQYHGDPRLRVRIDNFGGGPAKKVQLCLVVDGEMASGPMPSHAVLRPGEKTAVVTTLRAQDEENVKAVALCLDRENAVYTWSRDDDARRYKAGTRSEDGWWYFKEHYPDVDVEGLSAAGWSAEDA